MEDQLNQVNQNVQYHTDSIRNEMSQLQSMLYAENQWIQSENFTINQKDSSPRTVLLDYSWSFNEIKEKANVFVKYREIAGDWHIEQAQYINGTSYQTTFQLHPEKEYEYQVYVQGDTIKSSELRTIPFGHYRLMPLEIAARYKAGGKVSYFTIDVFSPYQTTIEGYQPKDIFISLYHGEKLLEKVPAKREHYTEDTGFWTAEVNPLPSEATHANLEVTFQNGCTQNQTIERFDGKPLPKPDPVITCE